MALTNKIATIVRIGIAEAANCRRPSSAPRLAHLGDAVIARVDAYPGARFPRHASAPINQSVDPNSRVFILEARVRQSAIPRSSRACSPPRTCSCRAACNGRLHSAAGRDARQDHGFQPGVRDPERQGAPARGLGRATPTATRSASCPASRGGEIVATNNQAELFDGAPVNRSRRREVSHARTSQTLHQTPRLRDDADPVARRGRQCFPISASASICSRRSISRPCRSSSPIPAHRPKRSKPKSRRRSKTRSTPSARWMRCGPFRRKASRS